MGCVVSRESLEGWTVDRGDYVSFTWCGETLYGAVLGVLEGRDGVFVVLTEDFDEHHVPWDALRIEGVAKISDAGAGFL